MAKVICMASAKGGSGKTTLTATFADFLCCLGKSVLIIDTDAATNGLTLLYLKEVTIQQEYALSEKRRALGTYEFDGQQGAQKEVVVLPNKVHLIPATYKFTNTENADLELFTENLITTVNLYRGNYDFIFLDAQAGSDHFAHASMISSVSDEVVIVSEYDPLSAAGVERLKALFRDDLTYNRTWVLLNKMLPEFVQSFSDFLEVAKYLSPIPWDADVIKAYSRRKLATDMEYGNAFTLAVIQTLRGMLGDLINGDIDLWLKNKAQVLKEPLEQQISDTKKLISSMYIGSKNEMSRVSIDITTLIILLIFILILSVHYFNVYKFINILVGSLGAPAIALLCIIILYNICKYVYYKLRVSSKNNTENFDNAEAERLHKKLEYLEGLMSANPETLIKSRLQERRDNK